jgi:hypothetical protein
VYDPFGKDTRIGWAGDESGGGGAGRGSVWKRLGGASPAIKS